ncbi:hypothetical protein B0H16DRAFT_1325573 [Mycena metata]|uniref:Uncharacterized protein n=1 Tax=Mycena metata TaxID=1033252 RepID=A0AAD7IBJ5_9AGAR|nr:hypothetical protein B0H16DRAFT_1325573 [Mycena metata]
MPTKREEALPLRYHFHDKPSDAAVAPLYTHLTSLRFLAISAPLKAGLRFTLALRIPLQNSYPAARQVPSIVAADCPNANGVVLRLNTALQRDLDRLSQVWTAEVVGVPGTSLVMKIIQPSLCPLPDPSNSKWREAYYDPLDLAHNEAWVYQMLAHRQGLSIPYFFGLFDIITPSGEAAWALVLEFVPGPTVHDIVTFTSTADVHDFVRPFTTSATLSG